jgi:selenium-binding protein 1
MPSPDFSPPDGPGVVDVKPDAKNYGKISHAVMMPNRGDELHHFGWNACSSALSPLAGHAFLSHYSRPPLAMHLCDRQQAICDQGQDPQDHRARGVLRKTGYGRPHNIHCGPPGIYVNTLGGGGPDGSDGPRGVFIMDCQNFEILGKWQIDRGPQKLH